MGPTVFLITPHLVSRDELLDFVYAEGGVPPLANSFDGWVAGKTYCVYVTWATDAEERGLDFARQDADGPDDMEWRETELATSRLVEAMLGETPRTYVQFDLIRGRHTQRVAWRLIKNFCKRWHPCVLRGTKPVEIADEGKRVWAMDEVAAFFEAKHRLPD